MASFQPAGIVAKITNSFYGHLDEKKNIYCLLFGHLMTIKANTCGLQHHAQLKHFLKYLQHSLDFKKGSLHHGIGDC